MNCYPYMDLAQYFPSFLTVALSTNAPLDNTKVALGLKRLVTSALSYNNFLYFAILNNNRFDIKNNNMQHSIKRC